ncbi:MAG: RNA polymerase sigma factor [Acidobacteriota bacterium]
MQQSLIEIPPRIREHTRAAVCGDAAAVGIVFQWYRPRLHAHALRICGHTQLAQDAVQDAFISAFTHLSALRDPDVFYPWLRRILINTCYRMMKKERPGDEYESPAARRAVFLQSAETFADLDESRERMHGALQHLSEELRSCVLLRYFSRFSSYDTIALVLGIPVGTVRSRLAAAREQLARRYLAAEDATGRALVEAQQWNDYYRELWLKLYDDDRARREMLDHHAPSLLVRYTSGKTSVGRSIIAKEIRDDLRYGSRFCVDEANTSGNVTVVEGRNTNPPEYPDRCAPSTVFVLFRTKGRIGVFHFFDSPRNEQHQK